MSAACRICNEATECTVLVHGSRLMPCPEIRYVCEKCQRSISMPAIKSMGPPQAAREQLAETKAELKSLYGELATICGGPGKPREGETKAAYWLGRVGQALCDEGLQTSKAIEENLKMLNDGCVKYEKQIELARALLAPMVKDIEMQRDAESDPYAPRSDDYSGMYDDLADGVIALAKAHGMEVENA